LVFGDDRDSHWRQIEAGGEPLTETVSEIAEARA